MQFTTVFMTLAAVLGATATPTKGSCPPGTKSFCCKPTSLLTGLNLQCIAGICVNNVLNPQICCQNGSGQQNCALLGVNVDNVEILSNNDHNDIDIL